MLTDIKARAARAKQKPYKLTDRDGLYLHVSTSGAKSWRFDYRLLGARQTLTIGQYPEVSLIDPEPAIFRAPGAATGERHQCIGGATSEMAAALHAVYGRADTVGARTA